MSKLKTIPFDPADYLADDVAIATYLSEALAAGDAGHFQEALEQWRAPAAWAALPRCPVLDARACTRRCAPEHTHASIPCNVCCQRLGCT